MSFTQTFFSSSHIFGTKEGKRQTRWLIHYVFVQHIFVLVLTVIVILRVLQVVPLVLRTQRASRLIDSVVEARFAYAFATAVVEPPVARGAHALAGRPTFVPGDALRHERDRAVHRHYIRLQRMQLLVCGFCQPKCIVNSWHL